MLAKWTEILPVFVVRWLALKMCERVIVFRESNPRIAAIARPDLLIVVKPTTPPSGQAAEGK